MRRLSDVVVFIVDFLHSGIGHFEIVNKKTDRNLLLVRSSSIICKREILHKTVICDKNIEHMEAMGVSISGSISLLSFMFYLPKRKWMDSSASIYAFNGILFICIQRLANYEINNNNNTTSKESVFEKSTLN